MVSHYNPLGVRLAHSHRFKIQFIVVNMNKWELSDSTHFQDFLVGLIAILELKDSSRDNDFRLARSKGKFDLLLLALVQNDYMKVG